MKTYFVDSFTTEPFKGNPAGVCILENEIGNDTMLNIAREIGFSETAFIKKIDQENTYRIRYFSPKKEMPLCGHATLASAKVLFESSPENTIKFITASGLELFIERSDEFITMEFPVYDTIEFEAPQPVLRALGLQDTMNTSYSPKNKIILIEISDADVLASLTPDFDALIRSYENINGVIVTAPSNTPYYDFHYRYFWPWSGTNEDPVTGGVQTFLAKYWSLKLDRIKMNAFQSSQRTGSMTVELRNNKVAISGTAVIVFEGDLKHF